MDKAKMKNTLFNIGRDLFIAFIVVIVVMLILLAYCRVWPPMVVVESGSMMHGPNSHIGVIDTGDMVLVRGVKERSDILTYMEGEEHTFRTYSGFGNVIVYRPNGDTNRTPIIHRAVIWLEINDDGVQNLSDGQIDYQNYTFDVPVFEWVNRNPWDPAENTFLLENYGHQNRDVTIHLDKIMGGFAAAGVEPHDGFVTMGDNNHIYDQSSGTIMLIKMDWIVGKATGELPWFGLIKLLFTNDLPLNVPANSWMLLIVTIIILVGVPLFLDLGLPRLRDRKGKEMKREEGDALSERAGVASPPTSLDEIAERLRNHAGDIGLLPEKVSSEKIIVIKEIVKVPCPYCDVLVESTLSKCPSCGGAIR